MRHIFVLAFFSAALALSGCSTEQSTQSQSQSQTQTSFADQSHSQLVIAPKVDDVPAHPLPFKGKLISGDKDELPPAVAMSLSDDSPVTFTYREELTHDDYHVPLALVRSIVQQESGWKSCVVSSKGAVGLMQLMPETARWLGVTDRCNVRQNIWGGVRYLAYL